MICSKKKSQSQLPEEPLEKLHEAEGSAKVQEFYDEEEMPEIEVNTLSPLFQTQIQSYKKDHFKTLPTIHHEFVYSCLHPTEEDFVLCLEKNVYPQSLELETLHEMTRLKSGEEVPLLWEPSEEDEVKVTGKKSAKARKDFAKRVQENIMKQQLNTDQDEKEEEEDEEPNEGDAQGKPPKKTDDDASKKFVEFWEPTKFENFKDNSDEQKHKYAISMWKLNQGRQCIQYEEYGFDGRPAGNKFFISQNGKTIFFFLSVLNQDKEPQVVQMVMLEAKTLKLKKVFDFPPDIPSILTKHLLDAAIMNGQQEYLLINDSLSQCFYFLHVGSGKCSMKIEWHLKVGNESKLGGGFGGGEGLISLLGKHSLLKNSVTYHVKQIFFKDIGKDFIQIFVQRESESSLHLYTLKIGQVLVTSAFESHELKIDNVDLNGLESIYANKQLDQFVFALKNKVFIMNKYPSKRQRDRGYSPAPKNGVHVVQKNFFLYDDLMLFKLEEDETIHSFFLSDQKRTYTMYQISHEKNEHMDIKKSKDGKRLYIVGKPNIPVPNISINVIGNFNMDQENQDIKITEIKEISDYKCCYPHIFFCKGNSELFVQSLNFKYKMLKMKLEDEFLCFVDITPHFVFKHDLDDDVPIQSTPSPQKEMGDQSPGRTDRQSLFQHMQGALSSQVKDLYSSKQTPGIKQIITNSHIAFLSQDDNENLFLTIIEFDPYTYENKFYQYVTKKPVIAKEEIKSQVIKAVVIRSYLSKNFQDYQLVVQLRDQIIVKSLFNSQAQNPLQSLKTFTAPMIFYPFCEAKKKKNPKAPSSQMRNDSIFFISKDFTKTKIVRLQYAVRGKDPFKYYQESRSQVINLFELQDKKIHLMDENLMVKILKIDEKNEKLIENDMLDMPLMIKEQWKKSESEVVALSSKTLYQKNSVIFLNSLENISKDFSFYGKIDLFTSKELRGGPINIHYTNSMMYLVSGLNKDEYLGEKGQIPLKQYRDHIIDKKKEGILEISEKIKVKKEEEEEKANLLKGGKGEQDRSIDLKDFASSVLIEKLEAARAPDGDLIYADEQVSESNVEILITPKVESKQITLAYDRDEPLPSPYTFQKIEKSTFIDANHNIMAVIGKKYCIFTKNGDFQGLVKFVKGESRKEALKQESREEEEKSIEQEQMEIYKQEQVRQFQEDLQEELGDNAHVDPILSDSKQKVKPQEPTDKNFLSPTPEEHKTDDNLTKAEKGDGQVMPEDIQVLEKQLQKDEKNEDIEKEKDKGNEKLIENPTKEEDNNGQTANLSSGNTGAKKINLALGKLKNQNEFLSKLQKETEQDFIENYFNSDQMRLLWMTNVVPEFEQTTPHTTYFVFYALAKDHLDDRNHQLAVYKLNRRKGQYELQFVKSCPLFKSTAFLQKENYFDMIKINSQGKVLQVNIESNQDQRDDEAGLVQNKQYNFEIYIDEEQILPQIHEKFPKTLQQRAAENDKGFGYNIIGDYLFVKLGKTIEYLKILNLSPEEKQRFSSKSAKVLNLSLDQKTKIRRITQTEKYQIINNEQNSRKKYYCPDFAQIILTESKVRGKCNMWVLTWDLTKNIEFSSLEVENIKEKKAPSYLCRGICPKLNYIVTHKEFFDIQFMAPFSFVNCGKQENIKNIPQSVSEVKVSEDKSMYLGMGRLSSINKSYSLQTLIYWREIFAAKFLQNLPQSRLHPEHLSLLMRRNNIFHMIALDYQFLKQIYDEIKKHEPSEDEDKSNPYRQLIFHLVYPNHKQESAFDIAMNNNSPKCVDIMLQMLVEVPEFRVSHFMKHHFNTLFEMNLESFESFLDSCLFTNIPMKSIKAIKWQGSGSEVFLDYHTSFIASDFQYKIFGLSQDDEVLFAKPEKKVKTSELSQYDPQIFDENLEELFANQKKRVEVAAVEFDWIFQGQDANNFILRLAETDNENLFTIPTVKAIILFLWQKYFYRILAFLFIPYVTYLVFFCLYVCVIYEFKVEYRSSKNIGEDPKFDYDFEEVDLAIVIISFIFLGYFFFIQFYQFWHKKAEYFKNLWNIIDLVSLILNLTMLCLDIQEFPAYKVRPVGACAVFMMFMKVFFYLRLFSNTSHMMRLIIECCIDMGGFAFILFLGFLAWASLFYILNMNAYEYAESGYLVYQQDPELHASLGEEEPDEPFYITEGPGFFLALIYSFRNGLGDFNLDFRGLQAEYLLWFMFIFETCFIQIVLLNLLISIMGDTFGRVTAIEEQNKLKEICQMIIEHDFFLSRSREYGKSKYIYWIKQEQAGGAGGGLSEGPIAQLAQTVHSMLSDQKKETEAALDGMKDELVAGQKNIDKKLTQISGGGGGNSQNSQQMQLDITQMKEQLNKNQIQIDDMRYAQMEKMKELKDLIAQLSNQVNLVGQSLTKYTGQEGKDFEKKLKVKDDDDDESDEEQKDDDQVSDEDEKKQDSNALVPKTKNIRRVNAR